MSLRIEFLYCITDSRHRGRTITFWDGLAVPRQGEMVWLASTEGGVKAPYVVRTVGWDDAAHIKCVVEGPK